MSQLRTFGRIEIETRAAVADGGIHCTLSSETPVTRGGYSEILLHEPGAINMTRADLGLPLLAYHEQKAPVGRVESIRLDTGARKLRGMLRFGSSPEAQQIKIDVEAGIVTDLSVGYVITEQRQDGDNMIVTGWEPLECSIVSVPADPAAGINRSFNIGENSMQQQINDMCTRYGVPELSRDLQGATLETARTKIMDVLATRDAGRTMPRHDDANNTAIADAIAARMGVSGASGDNRPMVEIAASCLEASGQNVDRRMSRQDLIARALTTSDFPNLLAAGMGKALAQAYATTAPALKAASRKVTLPDFRDRKVIRVGGTPDLKQVNENGEYTYSYVSDAVASWKLLTYGRIIGLSRQALVNDDLGAFNDLIRKFGESAARKEADVLAALLTSNPTVDALPMFDAGRGTQTTGAITVASLGAAIKLLRMQKEIDGGFIAAEPAFLIVPAALEMVAKQYTSTDFVSAKSSDINPFKGALEVIVEPRLDANSTTAWYVATAGGEMEHGYLDGNEGVFIETRNGFEVDGMEIKARLDFGAGFVAPTGWVKSTGV